MKIGIIVQARLGSSRLPNKVLMPLGKGQSVLEQVIHRLSFFLPISNIIVATTTLIKDKAIVDLCKKKSYPVFTGSPEDVLDRYYQCAQHHQLEHIVRIGADSPLIDPDLLKDMYQKYLSGSWDYLSNTLEDTFPEGLNAEFFNFMSLEKAWINAKLPSEREHVTPYIKTHAEFNKYSFTSPVLYTRKRWTLDYPEDYQLIGKIYEHLEEKKPYFKTNDILGLLAKHPEMESLNQHIIRNEGYMKSLKQDQEMGDNHVF